MQPLTIPQYIGQCYAVALLVVVGVALRLQGLMQGVTHMDNKANDKGSKGSKGSKVDTVASTVVTVAKVLLQVAGMQPPINTVIGKATLPNPLHLPHGASKRAMALAVYNAVQAMGYTDTETKRLAGVLLVLTGVGYCHATQKVLVGEVKGKRGLAGYIKPTAAWWGTTSNVAKAQLVQAYANGIVSGILGDKPDYATACTKADSAMQRYITKYGNEAVDLT